MCHILCLRDPFSSLEWYGNSWNPWVIHSGHMIWWVLLVCASHPFFPSSILSLETCFAIIREGKMTLSFSALLLTTRGWRRCFSFKDVDQGNEEPDRKAFLPQYLSYVIAFFLFLFLSFSFLLILSLPLKGFFVSVFYVSNRIAISNICDHRSDTWRKRLKEMKEMQLVKSLVKITIEKQRDTIWFSSHDSFLLLKQIPLRNSVTPGILLCPVRRGEGFVTEQQYTFQFKF